MKEIVLTNSEKKTQVDNEDFERLDVYSWRITTRGYVVHRRKRRPRNLLLSRFILDYEGDLQVDHINGDKLDNRKTNLRIVTPYENANNCHGFQKQGLGVSYNKKARKWQTYVWSNKKTTQLGYYDTKDTALLVRVEYVKQNPIILVGPICAFQQKH